MKLTSLLLATSIAMIGSAPAAITLNFTTFDGTEPTSDGNLVGFGAPGGGAGYDTVNGWTWGSDWTGLGAGPANGGVLAGLGTIRDQEIRSGASLELEAANSRFNFGFGGAAHQLALAQQFTATVSTTIDVNYDMSGSKGGMFLYIDDGSGTYTAQAHAMTNTATGNYQFTTTGTTIRIAVRGNDGADSDALLNSIQVVDNIPEPGSLLLLGLGGLTLLRRRR